MAKTIDQTIDVAAPYSKSPRSRLIAMAQECQRIEAQGVVGDIVECGVWRGGNIILARTLLPQRVCWLYDTFSGMHNPTQWDINRSGKTMSDHKAARNIVSLSEVVANLTHTGMLDLNYLRFVKGPVEDTLLQRSNVPDKIALLRLDTDWYASTKIELEMLWPRLQDNGTLIVDDYGHWNGARKAVDDYLGKSRPRTFADYSCIVVVK